MTTEGALKSILKLVFPIFRKEMIKLAQLNNTTPDKISLKIYCKGEFKQENITADFFIGDKQIGE